MILLLEGNWRLSGYAGGTLSWSVVCVDAGVNPVYSQHGGGAQCVPLSVVRV